jgi:hypothetical protein
MTPPARMTGVWITGMEEASFIPGATAMPDRNDPRRYHVEVEANEDQVRRLTGREFSYGYSAVALTFIGRRTLYPQFIDCSGDRHYTYTVDHLYSARYLGLIADADPLQPRASTVRPTGAGGEIGRLEARAVRNCYPQGLPTSAPRPARSAPAS